MENSQETGIFVIVGCFVMLALALGLITFLNVHRRKMLHKEREKELESFRSANESEERERTKIARDLHDGIVPSLTSIERNLEQCLRDFENNKFEPLKLRKEISYIEEAIETVRGISHNLVPPNLIALGLVSALSKHVMRVNDAGGCKADFVDASAFNGELPFSMPEQTNIFRMCCEILNNLHKHAACTYLRVTLENTGKELRIDFMHDGRGISNREIELAENSGKGLGLKSLRSRALILNANINYETEDDTSEICIRIPVR